MKDLVGNYLIVRMLKNEAYAPCLLSLRHIIESSAEEAQLTLRPAVVCKTAFQPAQKRALAAAACAADESYPALGDVHCDMLEGRSVFVWICKAQIADLKRRHTRASFASKSWGAKHSSANAAVPDADAPPNPLIMTDG